MKEQGCLVDCIYCKYIHPEFQNSKNCPKCHGETPYFQPAQMMDQYSSSKHILYRIFELPKDISEEQLYNHVYHLLKEIEIYGYDLKQSLIDYLKENEK